MGGVSDQNRVVVIGESVKPRPRKCRELLPKSIWNQLYCLTVFRGELLYVSEQSGVRKTSTYREMFGYPLSFCWYTPAELGLFCVGWILAVPQSELPQAISGGYLFRVGDQRALEGSVWSVVKAGRVDQ